MRGSGCGGLPLRRTPGTKSSRRLPTGRSQWRSCARESREEDPTQRQDDLFGTAVALAARIAAGVEGEKSLTPDVVWRLMADKGFLLTEPGQVVLRGLEDPMRLYEVRCEV